MGHLTQWRGALPAPLSTSTLTLPAMQGTACCTEKERLLDAYLGAFHYLFKLQNQKAEVAKSGEAQFELALQVARMRRDAAKRACKEHIEKHGC